MGVNLKELIRFLIGKIQSKRFAISSGKKVYIGKGCSIKGKKLIDLGDKVNIHSFAQIWSGGV